MAIIGNIPYFQTNPNIWEFESLGYSPSLFQAQCGFSSASFSVPAHLPNSFVRVITWCGFNFPMLATNHPRTWTSAPQKPWGWLKTVSLGDVGAFSINRSSFISFTVLNMPWKRTSVQPMSVTWSHHHGLTVPLVPRWMSESLWVFCCS